VAAGEHLFKQMEALRASPEWELRAQLEELAFVFRLHQANYQELKRLMKAMAADEETILRLWDVQNRTALEIVIEEASRLFLNFLSSAKTLVDHTRVHVRKLYPSSPFLEEYKAQLAQRLAKRSVTCFVQGLRNYSLHYRIPIVTATFGFKRDQPLENQLMLDISELTRWHRWDATSKKYMATLGEEQPLQQLVDDYMTLITGFYKWLHRREIEIHGPALARLQKRLDRLRAPERERSSQDNGTTRTDPAPPK
jgi:uncharacterized protein YqiB (DUF1249 family)